MNFGKADQSVYEKHLTLKTLNCVKCIYLNPILQTGDTPILPINFGREQISWLTFALANE